jgi:hypothetical protein
MGSLTRRAFAKSLVLASVLPVARVPLVISQTKQDTLPPPAVPDSIDGYALSREEKQLAAKFLADHETKMTPLREKSLPNSLPPNLLFKSPMIRKGEAVK